MCVDVQCLHNRKLLIPHDHTVIQERIRDSFPPAHNIVLARKTSIVKVCFLNFNLFGAHESFDKQVVAYITLMEVSIMKFD